MMMMAEVGCIGAAGCAVSGREIYKCLAYIVSGAV